MNILLLTPPLVQLNCPYPATTQLKAYIEQVAPHHTVVQRDMGIELIHAVMTRHFLEPLFNEAFQRDRLSERAKSVAMNKQKYLDTVEAVIRFMTGGDDTLAQRIAVGDFLPRGSRFRKVEEDDMEWAFGTTGVIDKARHYCSLYLTDITDFIADMVTSSFSLIRYGEQLALSAPTFDYIKKAVDYDDKINAIDKIMLRQLEEELTTTKADVVCLTIPFPGTLYAALRCARHIREKHPNIKIMMGGGYVNTELRDMTDSRFFDYTDYLLFDDGERPVVTALEHIEGKREISDVVRCKYIVENEVVDSHDWEANVPFSELPPPSYEGLDMTKYISMIELTNPMHKLWSDGRWNKLTVAHGCYWAKCSFCDTKLDYIARYDAPSATTVVDRIESVMAETKISGFHFTDEALPPKLLKEIAEEIIRRGLCISYWGNIRFEKSYDAVTCELLARSGCIAVSGGLEVASNRILKLINKGVTVEGAATAAYHFTSSGIMVHAYLMYGFPSETMQETIDALEVVRQMFEAGLLQSAFWHRYTMTVHSPSGCDPTRYNATRKSEVLNPFANNGVEHSDDTDIKDFKRVSSALYTATYNYMHGNGYDIPLKNWFESKLAVPTVHKHFVDKIIDKLD